ncbi:MAG: HPF/RaiA family ribosome-associated protein, partial [Thermoleophilia bacterium]|nr:HPF/RaiA family ribosome-associated protein [Thermoleophilia bacterium]
MRLEIRCRGEELGPEDRAQFDRRFRFALGRFATRVTRVAVYFGERVGPWGGTGQSCRVVISVPPGKPLAVEVLEHDRAAAADRAADRAGLA